VLLALAAWAQDFIVAATADRGKRMSVRPAAYKGH